MENVGSDFGSATSSDRQREKNEIRRLSKHDHLFVRCGYSIASAHPFEGAEFCRLSDSDYMSGPARRSCHPNQPPSSAESGFRSIQKRGPEWALRLQRNSPPGSKA
jgi:hypothetical protein